MTFKYVELDCRHQLIAIDYKGVTMYYTPLELETLLNNMDSRITKLEEACK